MLKFTSQGKHVAECSETGAYLDASRAQWILVYEHGDIYKTRHWQKSTVPLDQILARAQKSLDKITAQQKEK